MSHKVVAVSTSKIWPFYTYRNRNNVENWDSTFFFRILRDASGSNVTFQTANQSKYFPPILVPSVALKKKVRKHFCLSAAYEYKRQCRIKTDVIYNPYNPYPHPQIPNFAMLAICNACASCRIKHLIGSHSNSNDGNKQ